MKEKEFNELLQQIEESTFIGNKITISGCGYFEEGTKLPEALTGDHAVALANALKKNPNITIIELPFNNIGDIGAIALSSVNSIEDLELYGNHITVKGATALAKGNLKTLCLADNAIIYNRYYENIDYYDQPYATLLEMQEMIDVFILNKTITYLGFNNCYFSDEHDDLIAQLIRNNTIIKRLNLDSNHLTNEALKYIGNNTTLESIYLNSNNITDLGVEYIIQNYSLKEIAFGNNDNITEFGAKSLINYSSLENISIRSAQINIEELREKCMHENMPTHFSEEGDVNLSGDIDYHV